MLRATEAQGPEPPSPASSRARSSPSWVPRPAAPSTGPAEEALLPAGPEEGSPAPQGRSGRLQGARGGDLAKAHGALRERRGSHHQGRRSAAPTSRFPALPGGGMASLGGPFRVVHHEGQRFLCFYSGGGGSSSALRLHVTNASELWSCDVASDTQGGDMSLDEVHDSRSKLREALEGPVPTLAVRDSKAVLEFPNGGPGPLTFDLFRLPLSEARKQLQELMFGLVGQVQTLEKRLQESAVASAVPSPNVSPEKGALRHPSLFASELSPPKSRGGAGQAATKKRLPGESLINPGFKSKKAPTGVDFDDL